MSLQKHLGKLLIVIVLLGLLLAACANNTTKLDTTQSPTSTPKPTSRWPSKHTPQPATKGSVLIDANGEGNANTKSFTLYEDCRKVDLSWFGNPLDGASEVQFKFIGIDLNEETAVSGLYAIDTLSSGKDELSLSAGKYYLQVTAPEIIWSVRAVCNN